MQTLQIGAGAPPATIDPSLGDEQAANPASASWPVLPSLTVLALQDVVEGARAFRLWEMFGRQDVRQRYRRSTLGPFWLTISMGALAGGLGLLYAGLCKIDVADCLPLVAAGLILRRVISGLITGNRTASIDAEGIIKQVNLPLSAHVYRMAWRNFILFAQWSGVHLKGG